VSGRPQAARWSLAVGLASLVLVVGAGARLAWAEEHPDARKASIDVNPYHLDPSGRGLLSLGSTIPLKHLELAAAVTLQHVHAPFRLIDPEDGSELRRLVSHRQQLDLGVALGIRGRFEAGVLLPVVAHQTAEYAGQMLDPPPSAGLGDVVLQGRVRLLAEGSYPVGLALTMPLSVPTGNSEAYMGSGGLGFAPRLVVGRHLGDFFFAGGLGYHLQPRTELLNIVSGHRITYGAGVHFEPDDRAWSVDLEYAGATQASAPWGDADELYGEVVVGGSYSLGWDARLVAGMGRAQTRGVPSPSLRVFAAVAYERALRPDSDGDGLLDPVDRCPTQAEDPDGYQDGDGCPDLDDDSDGVPDAWDCCQGQAEDPDGFWDSDGCPDPDNDGDGIPDGLDGCPNEAEDVDGDADDDGCPDQDPEPEAPAAPDGDGDGVPDASDRCPDLAEDPDRFEDDDGCPDPDNDGDEVDDTADGCPDLHEDVDGFEDGDGCPDSDNDADGLPDASDECPNEREDRKGEGKALSDGCPLKELAVLTEQEIVIRDQIHFATGNAVLRKVSVATLRKILELLNDHPWVKLSIEGHTDANGTDKFNLWLSKARAGRVRAWLIANTPAHEAMAARLVSEGFGEGEPVADNDTEDGRAANRRVVFRVLKRKQ